MSVDLRNGQWIRHRRFADDLHTPVTERVFDYVARHDPRSLDYLIRDAVQASGSMDTPRWWTGGTVLDQGNEGTCVGHGWVGEYLASPVRGKHGTADEGHTLALQVFDRAAQLDEWPGESRNDGTSVLAGWKACRERQWYSGVRWAKNVEDVRLGLEEGPVVIGVDFREGMYETDRYGRISVSGDSVGGHCMVVTGYQPHFDAGRERRFRIRNSWGHSWGAGGNCYMLVDDLQAICFDSQGEAALATGRALGK
jgi:hypothetical protein